MSRPKHLILGALAVVTSAACVDTPSSPRILPPNGPARYLSSDTALSVTLYGPSKVLQQSSPTFRAGVTGGSGSYQYYWIAQVCYLDGYCRQPETFAQGVGLSSVTRLIRSDEAEVNIAVQVRETSEVHKSGVADLHVLGPATWTQGRISGSWGCRNPTQFPHVEHDVYRSSNGQITVIVTNYYARNCFGQKVYQP